MTTLLAFRQYRNCRSHPYRSQIQPHTSGHGAYQKNVLVLIGVLKSIDHRHPIVNADFPG